MDSKPEEKKALEEIEAPCECVTCFRCGGSGTEHWYLGDEFLSQGYSTCGTCGGAGIVVDFCPLHHGD